MRCVKVFLSVCAFEYRDLTDLTILQLQQQLFLLKFFIFFFQFGFPLFSRIYWRFCKSFVFFLSAYLIYICDFSFTMILENCSLFDITSSVNFINLPLFFHNIWLIFRFFWVYKYFGYAILTLSIENMKRIVPA